MFRVKDGLKTDSFSGSSPNVFIGHNFYPNLYVGILSPPERTADAYLYDSPKDWAAGNLQIPKIVDYRSSLINSRFRSMVKDQDKLICLSQEIGMASRPVDVEISLEEKPSFHLSTDPYLAPMGPNAKLKKAEITENPHIDTRVDKVVSDSDLKANQALTYLYDKGFDENFLTKILSVGNLGIKPQRKLVPTRWSITAADDAIAKHLLTGIKKHPQSDYLAYFGGYLGNYFLILFFPEVWSYELFETYAPNAEWNMSDDFNYMTDSEPYDSRKTYAENCGGGYYANRLAVLEKLNHLKRQASILTLRFITGEYAVPLGVWVVREASRKVLSNRPIEFSSKELMLKYAQALIKKKFGFNLETLLNQSILLKNQKTQKKISNY